MSFQSLSDVPEGVSSSSETVAEGSSSTTTTTTNAAAPPSSSSPPPLSCRVLLRTLTGQLMPIVLPSLSSVTVLQLKQRVEEQYAIPVSFQRTIFAGREMRDEDPLTAYGVENECVVHLVLRQNQQQQAPGPEGVAGPGVVPPPGAGMGYGGEGEPAVIAIPVMPGMDPGPMPDAEMLRTIQLARTVKIFSIIDCVFVILWSVSFWPFILALIFCLAGYHGSTKFKPGWVAMYGVYVVLAIALRVFWIYWDPTPLYAVLVGLGILIEFYIFWLVVRLVRALNQMTEQERFLASQMANPPRLFF